MIHIPVLEKEVIKYLDPKPNENFIDCTIGGGGHTSAILKKIKPNGKVLGIDWDKKIIQYLKAKNNLILVNDSYTNLKKIVNEYKFKKVSGILLDLGMSSWHLEKSKKGFSLKEDEILDMRYNPENNPLTAEKIINQWTESEIARILKDYGQERFAKRIARQIIKEREIERIKSTFQLVKIIKKAVPTKYRYTKIHLATRTFQALRITVNDELENLKKVLPQVLEILLPGGRLIIISFHSLEDRIVKNFLKEHKKTSLKILTKKPIRPSDKEIKINPRSRSAKLRAALKTLNN